MSTWEISLCKSWRAQTNFKEYFQCGVQQIRILLAEFMSPGRQETGTEMLGINALKNDRSRSLAMHTAALMAKPLVPGAQSFCPRQQDCSVPSDFWYRATVRSETLCLCWHQFWWCDKHPKGLLPTAIPPSLVPSPCNTSWKPAASTKHGLLIPLCSSRISRKGQTALQYEHGLDCTPCLGFCLASMSNLLK